MNTHNLISALVLGLAASACSIEARPPEAEAIGRTTSAVTATTPYYWWVSAYSYSYAFQLYGRDLNGRSLNGQDLTGHGVLGLSLTNVRLGKKKLVDVTLDDTTFHGSKRKGREFVGATFDAVLEDGSVLPVRIDAIHEPARNEAVVTRYTVSYETEKEWKPFCGTNAAGTPIRAVPLSGRWDYREGVRGGGAHIDDPEAFTFACDGYALEKCVALGYQPWLDVRECKKKSCPSIPMASLHQACTRAIRADYCGDGVSYTDDGTLIDIADGYGIRTTSPGWPFEAAWNADGARCATRLRVSARGTPTCWNAIESETCEQSSSFGQTLLITQDAP